jgi:hypothetical protein
MTAAPCWASPPRSSRLFRGRHDFVDAPARADLGPRVRLVLISDWGTGREDAEHVAARTRPFLSEPGVSWEYRAERKDDDGRYLCKRGFAVLDLDDRDLTVRYVDDEGTTWLTESI